jgi:hypothetical protein
MTPYERAMGEIEDERHLPAAEWFFAEIALLRERWDVFAHPFYARWSAGELGPGELRDYAEEHDHLVLALATVAQRAAEKADGLLGDVLDDHLAVVDERVAQWREFAKETGWGAGTAWHYAAEAYPETLNCVGVWLGDPARGLAIDLVTLAAAEPEPDPVIRAGLAGLLAGADPFALLTHVEAVHRAYWNVLDTLEGARTQ